MGVHDNHRINTLIDRLTLESLSLMEQHILMKIELEKCMVLGEGYVSKARYIMGQQQVSQLQLPNANSDEFHALGVVNSGQGDADAISDHHFDLEFREVNSRRSESADVEMDKPVVVNPILWFGMLVPQSLQLAQVRYKQTLQWSIRCVNVQHKLSDCLRTIAKLNKIIN